MVLNSHISNSFLNIYSFYTQILVTKQKRIPRNAVSLLSALCHKIELNAKTRQRFTPPPPTTTTPEKQRICLASASRRKDRNTSLGFASFLILVFFCFSSPDLVDFRPDLTFWISLYRSLYAVACQRRESIYGSCDYFKNKTRQGSNSLQQKAALREIRFVKRPSARGS